MQSREADSGSEKQLFPAEVLSVATAHDNLTTNIVLIRDEKLRKAAEEGTPVAYAQRLDRLRPKLSEKEWDEGVKLWASYIARSADLWEQTGYEDYCNLQEEGKSLGADAGFIFMWPFVLSEMSTDTDGDKARAAGVVVGPASMTIGIVGLGADVVTFIPNVAANAGEKLRRNVHLKRSAKAFGKFADFVRKAEAAHA